MYLNYSCEDKNCAYKKNRVSIMKLTNNFVEIYIFNLSI